MNSDVVCYMKILNMAADKALERGEESYSVNTDQLDYFPKDWESVYTYINENMLRLDNLYSVKEVDYDKTDDKWVDLFNYVRMGFAIMKIKGEENIGKRENT